MEVRTIITIRTDISIVEFDLSIVLFDRWRRCSRRAVKPRSRLQKRSHSCSTRSQHSCLLYPRAEDGIFGMTALAER